MADFDGNNDMNRPGEPSNGGGMQDNIMVRLRSLTPQDMAELDRVIDANPTLAAIIIAMFPEIEQDIMAMVSGGPPQQGSPMAQPQQMPGMPQPPVGGGGINNARFPGR